MTELGEAFLQQATVGTYELKLKQFLLHLVNSTNVLKFQVNSVGSHGSGRSWP